MPLLKRVFTLFSCLLFCLILLNISLAQDNKAGLSKQAQLVYLMENNASLSKKIKDLENTISQQKKTQIELADKIKMLQKEKDEAKQNTNILVEKITALEKERDTIAMTLLDKNKEADELKKQVSQWKAKEEALYKLAEENEEILSALKAREEELNAYKANIAGLDKDGLKGQLVILLENITVIEKEKAILEAMLKSQPKDLRRPGLVKSQEEDFTKVIHLNLGFAYGMEQKIKEAIGEYQKALEGDPEDKDIHYNLGYLLSKGHKYKEAIEEYKKALKGLPQDKEVYYNLAVIYATGLKDQKTGQEYYQKYLKLSSSEAGLSPQIEKPLPGSKNAIR